MLNRRGAISSSIRVILRVLGCLVDFQRFALRSHRWWFRHWLERQTQRRTPKGRRTLSVMSSEKNLFNYILSNYFFLFTFFVHFLKIFNWFFLSKFFLIFLRYYFFFTYQKYEFHFDNFFCDLFKIKICFFFALDGVLSSTRLM